MDEELGIHAPLWAYLEVVEDFYNQDRLDVAMRAALDSFSDAGWPAGAWTAFYNQLSAESAARDAGQIHKVDDNLSIELDRHASEDTLAMLQQTALEARSRVWEILRVEFQYPVLITFFLPDAPLSFIAGSHGYMSHKVNLDKICLPSFITQSREEAVDALMHEFGHVAVHQLGGEEVPRWLDEGTATYITGNFNDQVLTDIDQKSIDELSTVGRIQSAFLSIDMTKDQPERLLAAYYLSSSLVHWWVDHKGMESVRQALVLIGEGRSVESAVHRATGIALSDMERKWREQLIAI